MSDKIYTADKFIKSGGISSQFLKADGSEDSNVYATLANPSLTGTPNAPTATAGTNTMQIATTAFVQAIDVGNVKLTGTQGIAGSKTFNDPSYFSRVNVSNSSSRAVDIYNTGAAESIYTEQSATADAIYIKNQTGATGRPFVYRKNTTDLVVINDAGNVQAVTYNGIKKYVALLTQTGTGAPVATVLENTLGVTITWSRIMSGQYFGTASSSVFVSNKLTTSYGRNNIDTLLRLDYFNTTDIFLGTATVTGAASSTFSDSLLNSTCIEISVYP